MYKKLLNLFIFFLSLGFLLIILIMPVKIHSMGAYTEIFPALDLVVIYYISTYIGIKNWHLFIAGILFDKLYSLPLGTSSLLLIIANLLLMVARKKFVLQTYFTNICAFALYALFIISFKFLIITIMSENYLQGISVYFYYLTTIFSYPIMICLIQKPINLIFDRSHAVK